MGSRRPGRAGNMNGRVQGEVTRFAVISRVPTPTRLQEHPVPHMCVRKERKDPRIRPSHAGDMGSKLQDLRSYHEFRRRSTRLSTLFHPCACVRSDKTLGFAHPARTEVLCR